MDGVGTAKQKVSGQEMVAEFGHVRGSEYNLSGCSNIYARECYRWFIESIWLQAKTYTISLRVRSLLKTAELEGVNWAQILVERIRMEAKRVMQTVQGGHAC